MESTNINITDTIIESINTIFSSLFSSIDNSFYSVLDDLLFINSDIFNNHYLKTFIGSDNSGGLILICNALIFGILLYYCGNLLLSYFTFSSIHSPHQFIFRLFFCAIGINFSFFISEQIISIFSYISLAIRELGENIFGTEICFNSMIQYINNITYFGSPSVNIFSLDGILKSFISFGFFSLGLSFSLRYILVELFILLSPFAFLCLSIHSLSWIFKSWFKILFSLMFVQILVSIILLLTTSLDFTSNETISKMLCVGGIYAIIKATSLTREFLGGVTSEISINFSNKMKRSLIISFGYLVDLEHFWDMGTEFLSRKSGIGLNNKTRVLV